MDLAITIGMGIAMVVTVSLRSGTWAAPSSTIVALTALAWLPLLLRTRWPVAALAGTVLVESVILILGAVHDPAADASTVLGSYQPVPLASMLAAFTVALRCSRRTAWICGGVAAGVLVAVSACAYPPTSLVLDVNLGTLVLLATAVGITVAARRERVAQREHDQIEAQERAVVDERLRIARDLHDVLAHNLTLVNAQAAVAEYLLRIDPAGAAAALRDITSHTARAIDELRVTVGLLRRDGVLPDADSLLPVPDIGAIPGLVDEFREAGLTVSHCETGEPGVIDQQAGLAAYRIAQEALTNAAKHAAGSRAELCLRWAADHLVLTIHSSPPTDPTVPPAPGTGHGVIGMRERALAAGGTLRAEPVAGGGFLVEAILPVAPRSRTPDEGTLR